MTIRTTRKSAKLFWTPGVLNIYSKHGTDNLLIKTTHESVDISASEYVASMIRIHFPGWAKRCQDCIDKWAPTGVKPHFGLYFNFCLNAPSAFYEMDDSQVGPLPDLRPPHAQDEDTWRKHRESRRKRVSEGWRKRWKKFFNRLVNEIFLDYLDAHRMVKALPHVDAKNPTAGLCVLMILGLYKLVGID